MNNTVWVVYCTVPDLELQGVFSTKEKALRYLDKEWARCSDIWGERVLEEEDKFSTYWHFDFIGKNAHYLENNGKMIGLYIICHEIDLEP